MSQSSEDEHKGEVEKQYSVTDVVFDLDCVVGKVRRKIWYATDEEELCDKISNWAGFAVKSFECEEVVCGVVCETVQGMDGIVQGMDDVRINSFSEHVNRINTEIKTLSIEAVQEVAIMCNSIIKADKKKVTDAKYRAKKRVADLNVPKFVNCTFKGCIVRLKIDFRDFGRCSSHGGKEHLAMKEMAAEKEAGAKEAGAKE